MGRRNNSNSKKRSKSNALPVGLPSQQQQQPLREADNGQPHDAQAPRQQQEQQQQQQASADHDPFVDEFFQQPTSAPIAEAWDLAWEDAEERPRIAPEKRRAMVATAVIFGSFAVLLGSFTVYSQFIMPTPVALGASSGTFTLPTPIPLEPLVERVAEPAAVEAVAAIEPAPLDEPIVQKETPGRPLAVEHRVETRARAHASKVVATPSPAEPLNVSAKAMRALNAGQPGDARRLAQQAVLSNPERPDGWIVLGAAHDALGDHAAALMAYADCSARAIGPRVAACRALAR